jgi:hypothetical protein
MDVMKANRPDDEDGDEDGNFTNAPTIASNLVTRSTNFNFDDDDDDDDDTESPPESARRNNAVHSQCVCTRPTNDHSPSDATLPRKSESHSCKQSTSARSSLNTRNNSWCFSTNECRAPDAVFHALTFHVRSLIKEGDEAEGGCGGDGNGDVCVICV